MFQTSAGVISPSRLQTLQGWDLKWSQANMLRKKSASCKQNKFKINTKHFALYLKYSNASFFFSQHRGAIQPITQSLLPKMCLPSPPTHHLGMSVSTDHVISAFLEYNKHFIPPENTVGDQIKTQSFCTLRYLLLLSCHFKISVLSVRSFNLACTGLPHTWAYLFFGTCPVSFEKLLNACSLPGLCYMVLENWCADKPTTE